MTALWTGEALAKATGGALTPGCAGIEVNAVAIDTRTLEPGALFVALRGDNGDGHVHLAEAASRGAACAMVHAAADLPCVVRVADTRDGLQALGQAGRARFGGRLVAVTGSVGKTTTKEMLRLALGAFGPTHAAEASHNNHWGVPLTLARLPQDSRFAVCEIGTNHPGEIAPLAALAAPDVAIVTAIGASHIGHFGGLEAIAREKAAIYASLAGGGTAILPTDLPEASLLRDAVPPGVRALGFGRGGDAAIRLLSATARGGATAVSATIEGRTLSFELGTLGAHMASNALAVLAAVHALGLDVARAAGALSAFRPGTGRGLVRPIVNGQARLLDESYNASGSSVRAALEVLSLLPATRRVAFLGDMLELGAFAEAEHRALAGPAAAAADVVHTSGPLSLALHEALPQGKRGVWAADAAALAAEARSLVRPGDAVLVKGSNGSRMRLVVTALADHTA